MHACSSAQLSPISLRSWFVALCRQRHDMHMYHRSLLDNSSEGQFQQRRDKQYAQTLPDTPGLEASQDSEAYELDSFIASEEGRILFKGGVEKVSIQLPRISNSAYTWAQVALQRFWIWWTKKVLFFVLIAEHTLSKFPHLSLPGLYHNHICPTWYASWPNESLALSQIWSKHISGISSQVFREVPWYVVSIRTPKHPNLGYSLQERMIIFYKVLQNMGSLSMIAIAVFVESHAMRLQHICAAAIVLLLHTLLA